MAEKFSYTMVGVSKTYPPNKTVLKDIYLSFYHGAKIGIVGLNGAGKSTLLRIMAGEDKNINGEAKQSAGVKVGYLPQEPRLNPDQTVKESVYSAIGKIGRDMARFHEISNAFADPNLDPEKMDSLLAEQAELQERIEHANAWDLDRRIDAMMEALRLPESDAQIGTLSGGEKRRVALCRLLLEKPDMLLLDEPTNHLDAESVSWVEQFLKEFEGTVVLVTHDRYFLDNVTRWVLEIDRAQGIPWEGNYSSWLEQKHKKLLLEEKTESKRQKTLERELDWVRMNPGARRSKNKARLASYENLLNQDRAIQMDEQELYIPPGPRLGNRVIEAKCLKKSFGKKLLFENLSFNIGPGSVVGIIGGNGSGKTTLFRMITGQEKPDSGEIILGDTVKLAYVDQSRDALADQKTVWEEISDGHEEIVLGNREMNSRAYCARFNFSGADQQKKVGVLSGGERNRVHLAKLLKSGGNVLLLDEPSNDLDVNTLRALEDAIMGFAGCVLVISHDRWFLNRIATHILAFEGDSHVEFFEGNYEAYEEDKKRRLGAEASQPKRVRYRNLL